MKKVSRRYVIEEFSPTSPAVVEVEPGEVFVVETNESSRCATGAIAVKGAEPGDILAVTIRSIILPQEGRMWAMPGRGVFGEELTARLSETLFKPVPLRQGRALFGPGLSLPLNPMVGVIGVAPQGQGRPTYWPGPHGGNLDCKEVREGATIYLPVAAPGALLGVGDIHACMADGEVMLTGVEVAGEVTLEVQILRGRRPRPSAEGLRGPMIETEDCIMALGSAKTLEQAMTVALHQMHGLVQEKLGLSFEEAGMFLSLAGEVQVCQVVNPLSTMRVSLRKALIPGGGARTGTLALFLSPASESPPRPG
ncbi:MAG: acetamidase/formamidase family protein [Chloroflexota bacterium]|nr:acetamidase/formamidase family protein [Chloroflexota bacterium]